MYNVSAVYNILIYLFVHCKYIYLGIKRPVNIGLGQGLLYLVEKALVQEYLILIVCLHFEV